MTQQEILAKLAEPMPYMWRIGQVSRDKKTATALAYIDARDAAKRLNEVMGLCWASDYKKVGDVTYCGVAILLDGEWRWRWDAGVESNTEAQKGEASDAFKRACVKWGIGAFLYDMDMEKVKFKANENGNGGMPCDDNGNIIWDLTKYINDLKSRKNPSPAAVAPKQTPLPEKPKSTKKQVTRADAEALELTPDFKTLRKSKTNPKEVGFGYAENYFSMLKVVEPDGVETLTLDAEFTHELSDDPTTLVLFYKGSDYCSLHKKFDFDPSIYGLI
jgi:hypothetical protein